MRTFASFLQTIPLAFLLLGCSDGAESGTGEMGEASASSGGQGEASSQDEHANGGDGALDVGGLGMGDITPPMDDGSLLQQRCAEPWLDEEEIFDFDDQYIVLELRGPREAGAPFFIKSEDSVPGATYTVYNIPDNCRVYEQLLGSTEVSAEAPLCLTLSLDDAEAEPVERVLIHVSGQVHLDTSFFEAESCP